MTSRWRLLGGSVYVSRSGFIRVSAKAKTPSGAKTEWKRGWAALWGVGRALAAGIWVAPTRCLTDALLTPYWRLIGALLAPYWRHWSPFPRRSFKRTQICSLNRTLSVRNTLCRAGRKGTARRRPAPRIVRGLGDPGLRRRVATGLGGAGSRIGPVLRACGGGTGTA